MLTWKINEENNAVHIEVPRPSASELHSQLRASECKLKELQAQHDALVLVKRDEKGRHMFEMSTMRAKVDDHVRMVAPMVEKLADQARRLEILETELKEAEPMLARERAMTTSARIGDDGERWALRNLQQMLATHADVVDTSSIGGAGDIQICWRTRGSPVVMVEMKNTEVTSKIIRPAFVTQAKAQIQSSGAHAGLLLYAGPIGNGNTIDVQEQLVVVGNCKDPGQLVAGTAYAMALALRTAIAREESTDVILSPPEVRAVHNAFESMGSVLAHARKGLYGMQTTAKKIVDENKNQMKRTVEVVESMHEELRPPNLLQSVAMPRERLGKKRKRA